MSRSAMHGGGRKVRGEVDPGGLGRFLHLGGQCRLQVCEQFVWWVDHGGRREMEREGRGTTKELHTVTRPRQVTRLGY